MSTIAAIIILIAAIVFAVTMKNRGKTAPTQDNQPASPPAPAGSSPQAQYKEIMEALLKLNLLIRKDKDLSMEITNEIEAIVDDLAALTPAMMERYPGDALTYEMKKIGKEHLYKTVKEYLDLSPESRKNQLTIFQKTITSLHDVSKRSRDIVEKNETAEFKTMATFLAGKFS
ncbi:MAG: hypothetical protein ABIJ31_15150 [Pseudomonadota bacterium]